MGRRSDVSPRKKTALAVQLALLKRSKGRLAPGALAAVAKQHDVSSSVCQKIQQEAGVACLAGGAAKLSYKHKRSNKANRPAAIAGASLEAVLSVPVNKRNTYRAWAQTSSWRQLQDLVSLGEGQQRAADGQAHQAHPDRPAQAPQGAIHTLYAQLGGPELPLRRHGATLEPHHRTPPAGRAWTSLDGKIGLWPIMETTAAANNSKNRAAGTKIIKPLSVTTQRSTRTSFMCGGVASRLTNDAFEAVATRFMEMVGSDDQLCAIFSRNSFVKRIVEQPAFEDKVKAQFVKLGRNAKALKTFLKKNEGRKLDNI
ncbi:hypothetical protein JKP88DRAFT_240921 [Tribonema minus]|uniref:Uncharacterized protein n=1 Tax=Tribonema minus TaxID=303371 RepID=A0A835ZA28_9STRA|nr:hypothetical protein JKP88DRAFT_240921 [Tribonema minus]